MYSSETLLNLYISPITFEILFNNLLINVIFPDRFLTIIIPQKVKLVNIFNMLFGYKQCDCSNLFHIKGYRLCLFTLRDNISF